MYKLDLFRGYQKILEISQEQITEGVDLASLANQDPRNADPLADLLARTGCAITIGLSRDEHGQPLTKLPRITVVSREQQIAYARLWVPGPERQEIKFFSPAAQNSQQLESTGLFLRCSTY